MSKPRSYNNTIYEEAYGRLPPQAIDIEEAVLGALLLEEDSFQLVSGILKPEHFYKESHQAIYEAIVYLQDRDRSVDMLTVVQELKRLEKLDLAGGAYNVSTITSRVASAYHIEDHALTILDKYQRRKIILEASRLSASAYDETVDLDDIKGDIGSMDGVVFKDSASGGMKKLKEVNSVALEEIREAKEKKERGETVCLDTPLQNLNKIIGGFAPVEYIVLAARVGEGKTACSLAFAKHNAENGFSPAFFSLEMPGSSLSKRLLCVEAGVDSIQLKTGDISDHEFNKIKNAKERLDKLGIYVSDAFTTNISQVKASAKKLISKGKCDIIYLDYLQLMEGEGNNRQEQVSKISRGIKKMAKELNVPVIVMSQLSRASEQQARDPRPKLIHLRESGSIEQDADTVIMLFKPAKYDLLDDNGEAYGEYDVEFIVAKHRVGATGTAHAETNKTRSVYYDRSTNPVQAPTPFFTDGENDSLKDFQKEYNNRSVGGNLFPND